MTSSCKIHVFDCSQENDRRMVSFLQGVAASQKYFFEHIFPWETRCINQRLYVAYSGEEDILNTKTPPTICGWMNVVLQEEKYKDKNMTYKMGYITELTSRSATDKNFKGIGSLLLDALDRDAEDINSLGLDFNFLTPLNKNVVGFYKKKGYDFIKPARFMIKVFNKPPLPQWLNKYKPSDEEYMADILYGLQKRDKELATKFQAIMKKDKKEKYKYMVLDIYDNQQNIEDIIKWLEKM